MNLHFTLAAVAMAAIAAPAAAKQPPPTPMFCYESAATTGNAGYIDCQGPTPGNIAPGQVNSATFAGYGTFDLVGKTDDPGSGPFASNPAPAKSGTISFDSAQKGYFVLGIKGGDDFSLYLFNGGTTGITSLRWDTDGIYAGNVNDASKRGPDLSHLALFTQAVPEPETYALMLAGLAALGFVARRRAVEARG